jgi:TolB-like protein/Flp pilus assembly protein TadD
VEAYIKILQARDYLQHYNKEANIQARKFAEEVIALDPEYATAYSLQGFTHLRDVYFGSSKSPRKSLKEASKLAQKAIALDESYPNSHGLLANIYGLQRHHEKAIAQAERMVALAPNTADSYWFLGLQLFYGDRKEEAVQSLEKLIRLDPKGPGLYFSILALAYSVSGRYEEAIAKFKKAIGREPELIWGHIGLAATYTLVGREEEGRAAAAEVLKISPKFSLQHYARTVPWKNKADLNRWVAALRKAGLPEHPPLPLPDKPSIAVLPFVNMSDDPKQEYFVDGMTEDLITDLSQISGLFVIARNSVFRYKGKPVDVRKVSRELGVRYVLEGSVRKAGGQVRINAQLIDAATAGHLWAKRYDGKMDDAFALQDKIRQKIVTALAVKLTAGEKERLTKKETDNLAAYDVFLKGWGHYLRNTPEDYAKALSYFEKATELDPNYGRAYAAMALIYSKAPKLGKLWLNALYMNVLIADRKAKEYLQLAMRNPTSMAYRVASFINVYDHQYEKALSDAERSLSLDPNDSGSHENMAFVLIMAGRPKEAFGFSKKAMRLDPHNLANPLYFTGLAHFCLKAFEKAENSLQRALTYSPRHADYLLCLTAAYGQLGRGKEAKSTLDLLIETVLEMDANLQREMLFQPDTIENLLMAYHYVYPPFKEPEMVDLFEGGLIKAGLKEIHKFRSRRF